MTCVLGWGELTILARPLSFIKSELGYFLVIVGELLNNDSWSL